MLVSASAPWITDVLVLAMNVNLVTLLETWRKERKLTKKCVFRLLIESLANDKPSLTLPSPPTTPQ